MKSAALLERVVIVRLPLPELSSDTACGAVAVPTICEPNCSEAGVTVNRPVAIAAFC